MDIVAMRPRHVLPVVRSMDTARIWPTLLAALVLAPTSGSGALAEPIAPSRITVIDGDTIRVDRRQPDVRLVGLNAPETFRPDCRAERTLGYAASRRLRQIVSRGSLDLNPVRCACPGGTHGTEACNYGRSCAVLKANGEDVAAVLIREGLAVPLVCGAVSCPPTPKPWCYGVNLR